MYPVPARESPPPPPQIYDDDTEHFVNWQCRKCILSLLPFYDSEHEEDISNEVT